MTMKDKKSSHLGIWLIAVVLLATSYIVFIQSFKDGINIDNSSSNSTEYDSIADLLADSTFSGAEIPEYVTSSGEELNISVEYGSFATIYTDTFVFKFAQFVGVNANALALYEDAEIDHRYYVDDSNVTYFRYRQQYSEYPNCTIIDWCTDEMMYGLMIEDDISEDDAKSIVGISNCNLTEYIVDSDSEAEETSTELVGDTVTLSDNIELTLPEFSEEVETYDLGDMLAIYSGETFLFLVADINTVVGDDNFSDYELITCDHNMIIAYYPENTYDPDSNAYDDYELLLSTIDNIALTMVYNE
jgi:hypothetical protein